jgi:hypothetical protein
VRVAREAAPAGLVDGVWLQGMTWLNVVETRASMALLRQTMIRFGDPGARESYGQRYASLLRSLGIAPGSVARFERPEGARTCDLSYEHALLGLGLALFPSTLAPETIGFNWWMAAIGPNPLLEALVGQLRALGAALGYFEMHDRDRMAALARAAVRLYCAEDPSELARQRLLRGFCAAQRSYQRWETGMLGRNVPRTPRQFVREMVRRKAPFAAGHHAEVRVAGHALEHQFASVRDDPDRLLDVLAGSSYVRPGAPDASPLITSSIEFGGPMFDVFTAAEKRDLREWITSLPAGPQADEAPIALHGTYAPSQDLESLRRYVREHYAALAPEEVTYRLVNADRYPPARLYGRGVAESALAALRRVFAADERLSSTSTPEYSEAHVAEMAARFHQSNVRSRKAHAEKDAEAEGAAGGAAVVTLLDGCWLQGFGDVQRVHLEEFGWLFRIYASEMGDGDLEWNHNYIVRRMFDPPALTPTAERQLFDEFATSMPVIITFGMVLNTRRFLPELLGFNLGTEASGVGGYYFSRWKTAEARGQKWKALYNKLHNSIDNYADGHTSWSVHAVHAYMSRVKEAAPEACTEQWRRIWSLWRFYELSQHGSDAERQALVEVLGMQAGAFVPSE